MAAKWEIEKRAIMIHAPAPIYGPTGQKKKTGFCVAFNEMGHFYHYRCLKLSKLIFQSDIRRREIKERKILPIVSCVVHLYQD